MTHSAGRTSRWVLAAAMLTVAAAAAAGEAFTTHADGFDTAPVWPVFWSRADAGFRVDKGRLIASDGARKSSYAAILTRRAFGNFVMQWTWVRLADHVGSGDGERAIILAGVDDKGRISSPNNIWLRPSTFQVNQLYAMRLVVVSGEATLWWRRADTRDETVLRKASVPRRGRVGFCHYKRYAYAYDDVRVTVLPDGASPPPARAGAFVLPGGVVRLRWSVPDALRAVFRYRVARSSTPDMAHKHVVGETHETGMQDAGAPANSRLYYQVASLDLSGKVAVHSRVVNVDTGTVGRPGAPQRVFACPRRTGGVTVRWNALQGQPVKEYRVRRRKQGTKTDEAIARQAQRVTPVCWFIDPQGRAGDTYAVLAVNVRGERGPATWVTAREPEPLEFAGRELMRLLGVHGRRGWRAPSIRKVDPDHTAVRPHPRLLYTQEQIDRAKQRIRKHEWAKRRLTAILRRADEHMPHTLETNRRTFAQAAAYALTGREAFAKKVRDTLVWWADRYRGLPLRHGEARIAAYFLSDTAWLSRRFVQPYDLIYPSASLSDGDRRHIENDLIRPMADDLMIRRRGETSPFHTVYNWHANSLGAVGLAGFCLNEKKYVDWALSGPYGLLQQVASQVMDDGFFWEKTISYHMTTAMPPLYALAEAAYNNNMDVWHTPVPDTCLEDYGIHFAVDGDNGPKTLQLALDAPLYFMLPDHTGATFGDSVANRWYGGGYYYLAWLRYGEARYAWFNAGADRVYWSPAASHLQVLTWWDGRSTKAAPFRIGTGRFANTGVAQHGSTLFPSTGYAVLRQDETHTDAPALAFTYGPWGGGHNHGDRLAYILYARRAIPVYRTSTYHQGQPGYAQYRCTSISYNTVVVDETSHRTGTGSDDPNTGRLDFFHGDPFLQAVGAHADVCYPDVFFRRALLLGPDCLVDVFICRSPNEHVYDYALHVDGQWHNTRLAPVPKGTRLGLGNGYQAVDVVARGRHDKAYAAQWPFRPASGSARLAFHLVGAPGAEIIACQSPGLMKHKPLRAMLVARRRTRNTVFVSVLEICDNKPTITAVEPIGMAADGAGGVCVGLRLCRGPFTEIVLYNETGRAHRFGDITFAGRAAWLRCDSRSVVRASVVQARAMHHKDLSRRWPTPTSASIVGPESQPHKPKETR